MVYEDPAAATRTHLMARLSSGAACLANQRGVYSMAAADPSDLPSQAPALVDSVSFFSTPSQRAASSAVHGTSTVMRSRGRGGPSSQAEEDHIEPIVQA